MATGLEALGAASAVIQLVSFSTSVISKAINVYQGRPLSDSSVEKYAEELQNAVAQVELCCQGANMQQSAHERKITEIAKKCQKSARELQGEVRSLSSTRQSGRARSAFFSAWMATFRQKKLEDLEKTLRKQQEVLETHLLTYICNQTQAVALTQKREFQTLSGHVQNLVGQIAAGNTSLESRVQAEHGETRALLVKEVKDTGGQVTSDIATASQRTRFLDSLKSNSMNQRYNDIKDPKEATYQRIFAAYDGACDDMSEPDRDKIELLSNGRYLASIGKGLDQLANWLQTSDSLFWISGKPGSGKSTFMKTIVNSSSVKMLLESYLCMAQLLSTRGSCFIDGTSLMSEIHQAVQKYDPDSTKKAQYEQHISTIMARMEKAYSYGYVKIGYPTEDRYSSLLGLTAQWETFDGFTVSHARKIASSTAVEDLWRGVWNRNFPPTEDVLMSSMRLIKETLPFASNWHRGYNYAHNFYDKISPIIWRHTPFTRLLVEGLSIITWINAVAKFGKRPISETALSTFLDLLLIAASNVPDWDGYMIIVSQFFPAKGVFLAIPRLSNCSIYTVLCQATQDDTAPESPELGWVFYHQVSMRFMFQKVVKNIMPRVAIPPSLTGQLVEISQARQDLLPRAQLLIRLKAPDDVTCYQTVSQASFEDFNSILFTSSSRENRIPMQLGEEISALTDDPTATKVISLQLAFHNLAQLNHGLCKSRHEGMPASFERRLSFAMLRRRYDFL